MHAGRFAHSIDEQPVSASDVAAPGVAGAFVQPRPLTIGEIEEVKILQDTEVIDKSILKITHQKTKCQENII